MWRAKKVESFISLWKASFLGIFLVLFLSLIPNLLTLGLLGVYAHRKHPMKFVEEK